MKFQLKAIATMVAALAFSQPAHAAVDENTPIGNETLAPLAQWVMNVTGTQMQALPIAVASSEKLAMALKVHGVSQARAAAAYIPGRIMINNVLWDPDSIRSQSYIVHELVHHAQLVGRKEYACNAAKEKEAYELQNQWLSEHNQPPIVSQDWIDRISACGGSEESAD